MSHVLVLRPFHTLRVTLHLQASTSQISKKTTPPRLQPADQATQVPKQTCHERALYAVLEFEESEHKDADNGGLSILMLKISQHYNVDGRDPQHSDISHEKLDCSAVSPEELDSARIRCEGLENMHVTFDKLDRSLIGPIGPDRVDIGNHELDSINVDCAVSEGMDIDSEGSTGLEYMDDGGMDLGVMSGAVEGFTATDIVAQPERFLIRHLDKNDPPRHQSTI